MAQGRSTTIVSMIKIRTSRLSIKNSSSLALQAKQIETQVESKLKARFNFKVTSNLPSPILQNVFIN